MAGLLSGEKRLSVDEQRYCSECGAELATTGKFCNQCGAQVQVPTQSFDGGETEPAAEDSSKPRPKLLLRPLVLIPVGLVIGLGILWFIYSSVFNTPEAQLARCISEGNHNLVAKRTAQKIVDMTTELNRASNSGEAADLYFANNQLNNVYGPSFVSLGQEWARLDDCDSSVTGPLQEVLGQELISLGVILSDVEVGDTYELNRAVNHMENIGDLTSMLSVYLDSQ